MLPLLTVTFFQLNYFNGIIKNNIENDEKSVAHQNVEYFDSIMQNNIESLTKMAKANPDLLTFDKERVTPLLNTMHNSDIDSEAVVILDKDGHGFNQDGKDMNNSDRDYFKQVKETQKPVVSNVIISKTTGNRVFVSAVPLFDNSNQFQGDLHISLSMKALEEISESIKIGKSGYGYVIDKSGTYVTSLIRRGLENHIRIF
jgi:methyl-accepting chemotaxis protein